MDDYYYDHPAYQRRHDLYLIERDERTQQFAYIVSEDVPLNERQVDEWLTYHGFFDRLLHADSDTQQALVDMCIITRRPIQLIRAITPLVRWESNNESDLTTHIPPTPRNVTELLWRVIVNNTHKQDADWKFKVVEHLIELKADVVTPRIYNARYGISTCLSTLSCTDNHSPELPKLLLTHKADVNWSNSHGWTALHWAARNQCTRMAQFLLVNGANPKAPTKNGDTPMTLADRGEQRVKWVLQSFLDWSPYTHSELPHNIQEIIYTLLMIYYIGGYDESVWQPSMGQMHCLPIELLYYIFSFCASDLIANHPLTFQQCDEGNYLGSLWSSQ